MTSDHIVLARAGSGDIPRVLEAEVRDSGAPLGLHGLPGGGGAAQARLRRPSARLWQEPHHGPEGAHLPIRGEAQEDRGRRRHHSSHGETWQ